MNKTIGTMLLGIAFFSMGLNVSAQAEDTVECIECKKRCHWTDQCIWQCREACRPHGHIG